jgi:TonB family protein
VTGFLRPRIVVPEKTARKLNAQELRAVLLHEDAHRRRFEPLRFGLQRLALTVFFFYPPLWLLLRELNSSAEMACDEAVLEAGTGMETYTAAIARVLGFWTEESLAITVLGFGGLSPIRARLRRLEGNRRYMTMGRHRMAILAAALVVLALSFIPMAPLADSQPAPPAPPAPPAVPEEVDTPPQLLPESMALPEYPEGARTSGAEGEILLEVLVREDGTVANVEVRQGIPGHPELAESAVDAVRHWTFKPGLRNGEPVESEVLIPLAFSLDDSKPKEVETPPAIIPDRCPLPEYPNEARSAGVEGRVLLEVLVSADGSVADAVVKEGIEGHPELDRAAVDALKQWRFQPATSEGVPVDMSILVPLEFRLQSKKAEQ